MDARDISDWPSLDDMIFKVAEEGVNYTEYVYKKLQCQDKLVLTPEMAIRYNYIQKEHVRLTGYSLPDTIKGAMKTRAQSRDDLGPTVKDEVLDKAVQDGLAARLKQMRSK